MVNISLVFEKLTEFVNAIASEKANKIVLKSNVSSWHNVEGIETYLSVVSTFLIKCVCFFEKTEVLVSISELNTLNEGFIILKIQLPKFYFNPNLFLNKNDSKILQIANEEENYSIVHAKIPTIEMVVPQNTPPISNLYVSKTDQLKTEYLNRKFEGRFTKTSEDPLILNKLTANNYTKNNIFIEKLHSILALNVGNENFDSNELIRKMDYSKAQLFRKLKELTGLSASNYIKFYKLEMSKEFLLTTNLNISEIGFKVGFSDLSYFTNSFKKQYGVSPTQFRISKTNANS